MLLEWHLKENSMVSSSATQFIWRLCFPYVYMSPCEANILRVGIFLEEDRETQKINLNYALNYAPGEASKGKFHGKYLRYSVMWSLCFPYVYMSPCEAYVLRVSIFLEEDR